MGKGVPVSMPEATIHETIYLVTVYLRSEQDNLTV